MKKDKKKKTEKKKSWKILNETNDAPIQIESNETREVNNENDKWMKCACLK